MELVTKCCGAQKTFDGVPGICPECEGECTYISEPNNIEDAILNADASFQDRALLLVTETSNDEAATLIETLTIDTIRRFIDKLWDDGWRQVSSLYFVKGDEQRAITTLLKEYFAQ